MCIRDSLMNHPLIPSRNRAEEKSIDPSFEVANVKERA